MQETEGMVEWLRVLTAPVEDPAFPAAPHNCSPPVCDSSLRTTPPSSGLHGHCMHMIAIHIKIHKS